jgi:hypothetical protein
MPKDRCKLCLEDDTELQLSHLTPAKVYRLLDSPNAPNRNPFLITSQVTVQTAREIRDYLLCRDCEELLSRKGENWVVPRLAAPDKTFPLHDILTTVAPDVVGPDVRAYAAARNPEMRVEDLTHFALGVFWKASARAWRSGPSITSTSGIDLGPFGDSVRLFLLGIGPFPERVALGVALMPPPVTTVLSYLPREGTQSNGVRHFSYYVPGVLFMISIGGEVSRDTASGCFYNNPLHPILVKDLSEEVQRHPKKLYFKAKAAMALRSHSQKTPTSNRGDRTD